VRDRYADFGPTLAAEKLAEHHGLLGLARDLVRLDDHRWAVAGPSASSRFAASPRRRRDCLGELVQIDGSEHAWFEDRGPPCTLLAFVDDATSRLMQLRFVTSESAFDYFRTTRDFLSPFGRSVV
jgi:hypothetical protein